MRRHDQQGTPFKQNLADFLTALFQRDQPREDGRGWFNAVTHELLNIFVELYRAHPKVAVLTTSVIILILAEWLWSGSLL